MQPQAVRAYQLDRFQLDLARRCLVGHDGSTLPLSGRGYDVLAYLVENRHRVVGKDELMKAVWPRVVVEENSLTQAISSARRALGDARESPLYIATVAGRGYQFVGDARPVTDVAGGGESADPRTTTPVAESGIPEAVFNAPPSWAQSTLDVPGSASRAPPPGLVTRRRALLAGLAVSAAAAGYAWTRRRGPTPAIESIAVLPFKPLSGGERDEAVEMGIAELLIIRLSRVRGIVVAPLSSVIQFSGPDQDPLVAGRKLGVDAVVDGYVQIRDGHIRITARLLDTEDGNALWSGSFTEPMREFFVVQDSIATRIASAVSVVAPGPKQAAWSGYGTLDAEAWQLYADGRFHLDRRSVEGIRSALTLFEAAQARDPRFALAFASHSDALILATVFGIKPTVPAMTAARNAALQALAIDPDLPDSHAALGHVLTQFDRDFAGGRQQYHRALELQPDHAWSHALLALNLTQSSRLPDALRHIRQAQSLEPAALPFMSLGAWVQYFARQPAEAEQQLARIVQSVPAAAMARQFLARVLLARRDVAATIRLLEGHNDPAPGWFSNLGRAYAIAGRTADAQAEIARVEDFGRRGVGVGFDLALLHLALGNRSGALESLERAVGDHSQMLGYLNVEPALDPIRGEPAFRAVARQIDFG